MDKLKKFYFKTSGDIITDAIDYPHEGYVEVQLQQTHLPAGINGGWFKLEGGVPVEYPELKPKSESDEMQELKQSQADQDEILMTLLLGGM